MDAHRASLLLRAADTIARCDEELDRSEPATIERLVLFRATSELDLACTHAERASSVELDMLIARAEAALFKAMRAARPAPEAPTPRTS